MASKSKRRGRVFRASCILAALIIAGSSFAWFTSKDEVTNRLSASADYNVVAIENFSPPKQFVPGQTVKKEEAVTNTGSIDAFVKQTITGALEVTVEVPTTIAPADSGAEKDKYIKYTKQNEWGAIEAGSMLAWKPEADTTNKTGVVIGMGISGEGTGTPEGATGDVNDFDPAATGLYVFRRAVDQSETATQQTDVDYDYVAYYYVAPGTGETEGTYYKVYALKVDEGQIDTSDYLTAGILKKEPAYTFSKAVTTYANKQDMYYQTYTDTDGVEKKRLVVKFNGRNTVDEAIVTGSAATNAAIYQAYKEFEDQNLGRTVYVAPDTGTYKAYTTWDVADASQWGDANNADTNATGLTTYDMYNQDEAAGYTDVQKTPQGDLSNFGLDRLKNLQTETNTALKAKEEGYADLQTNARNSRKTVNEGRDAEIDLQYYLDKVHTAIGDASPATGEADSTKGGLYLKIKTAYDETTKTAGTYEWQAHMISDNMIYPSFNNDGANNAWNATVTTPTNVGASNPTAEGLVAFNTDTDNGGMVLATVTDNTNNNLITMTADNIDETRFKDPGSIAPSGATWVTGAADGAGVEWIDVAAPATSGDVLTKWQALVYQTQRKVLNLKKQELVQKAIDEAGGIHPSSTDVARSELEAQNKLADLKEQLTGIENDLANAQSAYYTVANEVKTEIEKMNRCQAKVDLANAEYNTYMTVAGNAVVKNNKTTDTETYTMPTAVITTDLKDVTAATVVNGTKDSVKEDIFENKLLAIFGDAVKDTSFEYKEKALDLTGDGSEYVEAESDVTYKSTYTCEKEEDELPADTVAANKVTGHAEDVFTYSVKATKDQIDNNLSVTEATGVTNFTTGSGAKYTNTAAQNKIKSAPYWKDVVTDNMVERRTNDANKEYADYQALLDQNAMLANQQQLVDDEGALATDEVKLYVNLVNVVDDVDITADETNRDKWQYVGESDYETDKSAKEFVFGYTGILEAGETSSLLIKSVEFDKDTTQDSFRDLKFDINVLVESAQAVYNANRVESTAAKEGITVISPTEPDYASVDEAVKWEADATSPTTLPKDNDPNPKDVDVAPKKYTVSGEPVATPVELGTPITVGTTEYKYAIVVAGKTYYGTDKTNGTEYKEANEDGTGLKDDGAKVTLVVE
jgi:predicted ribosomally synthesized peptide with SipW-like signal peptide